MIDILTWLTHRQDLELFHYAPVYCDDDDLSKEWRVVQRSGCINDREWKIIGRGQTPSGALEDARRNLEND